MTSIYLFFLTLFFILFLNYFFLKNNFLLDDIKFSKHKSLAKNKKTPISLGFIFVIFSRFLLGLNKKKFFNVTTLTNSKWSLQRLKKTYLIKVVNLL